jgi:predicted DNA-binding transcriptional regulator AlpA
MGNVLALTRREAGDRFIKKKELCHRVGLSAESIRTRELAGTFPRRIRLSSQSVCWSENDVNLWMQERIANSKREPLAA